MKADKYYSLFVEAGIINKVKIWLDDNPPPEKWESSKGAWAYTEMWLGTHDYAAIKGAKERLAPAYEFDKDVVEVANLIHDKGFYDKLKIYVWDEFDPDYTAGLAVAIAESEGEAKEMITEGMESWQIPKPEEWGPCQEFPLGKKSFYVKGGA